MLQQKYTNLLTCLHH